MAGISPKLPIRKDPIDGFSLNKTIPEAVHQNLKNLFLTAPGERIMDPDFGVGLRNYLFEQNVSEVHEIIKKVAIEQVKKYMPFVILRRIDFFENERTTDPLNQSATGIINNNISYDSVTNVHRLNIAVTYSIKGVNVLDVLKISVDLS
jgi:phage baseplate assembly protein W